MLADHCRVRQPTMTVIVESLLSSGYVERRPTPTTGAPTSTS
ncbi:MarR family transcriptional regulator [Nocardiopsis sp. ARC36]